MGFDIDDLGEELNPVLGGRMEYRGASSKKVTLQTLKDLLLLLPPNNQGGNYTLTLLDRNYKVRMTSASANTLTIPPDSSVNFTIGTVLVASQVGAGTTTVVAGSGVTLRYSGSLDMSQHQDAVFHKVGANEWDVRIGNASSTSAGGGADADATAYINAVEATGVSITPTQEGYIHTLVTALKTAGVWTKRRGYYMPIWGTAAANAINMKSPGTYNLVYTIGTQTHGASGLTGTAAVNADMSTLFPSVNSTSAFIYTQVTDITAGVYQALFGYQDMTPGNTFALLYTSGASPEGAVNNANAALGVNSHVKGWNGLNRNVNTSFDLVHNGASVLNVATASAGVPNASNEMFAFGNIRTSNATQPYQIQVPWSFACFGDGLTSGELTNENAAVEAAMDSFGLGQQP